MNHGYLHIFVVFFIMLHSLGIDKAITEEIEPAFYLGESLPGDSPVLFGADRISTHLHESGVTFTQDGSEIYFARGELRPEVILVMRRQGNTWTGPDTAWFSGVYWDGYPSVSPDGRRIYFASHRPWTGGREKRDWDIWMVERSDSGWSEPSPLDKSINTENPENSPSVSLDGTLYFVRYENHEANIYRVPFYDGVQLKPEKLGAAVNTPFLETHPWISPDGGTLLFSSVRRIGYGESDLYASFLIDSRWTPAQNLGKEINSHSGENNPVLSPDGRFLFFTSSRLSESKTSAVPHFGSEELYNGLPNIFWVRSALIDSLQKKAGY